MGNVNTEVIAWQEEKHQERISSATAAIVEYLVAAGETTKAAETLAGLMREEDDRFSVIFVNGVLNRQATETFRHKAKASFEKNVRDNFPQWHLTDAQKKMVIGRCLTTMTFSQVQTAQPEISFYADALDCEIERGASEFHCPVCMEPFITRQADG